MQRGEQQMHSETDYIPDEPELPEEAIAQAEAAAANAGEVPDAEGRTWVDWAEKDVSEKEVYRYFMRTDPGMREFLGPIEKEDDPLTGKVMRWRWAKIAMMRGKATMFDTKVFLDPWPHIRLGSAKPLQGWYSDRWDGSKPNQRDRPCDTDAILTQPYGGFCNIACQFCYINSGSRGYRGSGLITVPVNYGEWVKQRLAKMQRGQAGYFSSFTEPFINLEDTYHNTQAGATAFVEAGLPIFFLSRRKYPDWAIDLLKKNPYSYAQKSINTPDPVVWKKLSPNAIGLEDNFADLKKIHDAGIYTSIQLNPVIPGLVNHEDVEELIEKLVKNGADHITVKFVECSWAFASTMIGKITKSYGDVIGGKFAELFTENQCGAQRTINESYRRDGHNRYRALCTKLGATYSLCYEYTNVNRADPNAKKVWHSMGEEFRTSEQCHGHRIPFHVKTPETGDRFIPMEDYCPPAGCLTCPTVKGDGTLGACGDPLFSDAKALVEKHFKVPYAGKPVGTVNNPELFS
jgi:DNA repair photolyase